MVVVADATMAAGGEVIGIIAQSLKDSEIGHTGLTRLEVVDGMHARKARMAELSDAFVALPGGLGTLEELFEVWTWGQLGYHSKPLGLLDINQCSKLSPFPGPSCRGRLRKVPLPHHAPTQRIPGRPAAAARSLGA